MSDRMLHNDIERVTADLDSTSLGWRNLHEGRQRVLMNMASTSNQVSTWFPPHARADRNRPLHEAADEMLSQNGQARLVYARHGSRNRCARRSLIKLLGKIPLRSSSGTRRLPSAGTRRHRGDGSLRS